MSTNGGAARPAPLLAAVNLGKSYGHRVAVEDVTLALSPGEVLALLGPNGAGKTTTLRLLAGLLRPSCGTVSVGDRVQDAASWPLARARIGFLTEMPGLWDRLSVEANLLTYARLYAVPSPRARTAALLRRFDLADRAGDPAGSLSKGMRQKVALARALLHDPPIVLLDEPTAGLDPAMTRSVRELIGELRADGRAVLLSTHNLDEAERVADRIAVLTRTLVALDTPDGLRWRRGARQLRVTLDGEARRYLATAAGARALQPRADGTTLYCSLEEPDTDTPVLVQALVAAGARIRAVVPEEPGLEEIYLALTRGDVGVAAAAPGSPRPNAGGPSAPGPDHQATGIRSPRSQEPEARSHLPRPHVAPSRVAALVRKEWADLRGTWAPWLPALLMLPMLALPFLLAVGIPVMTGERLEQSDFAEQVKTVVRAWPALASLPLAAATQALIFSQFLVLVVLVPISGAMSIAAHAIIGEKQGRTLEPLLTTPLTTLDLLLAKVLAALAPAVVLEVLALVLYLGFIATIAEPGVLPLVASRRTALVVGLVGPLATLLALQLVILASTRAKDPRSAQQVGVLVVLPIGGVIVAQTAGTFWLTGAVLLAAAAVLALAWVALLSVSVAVFDAERILTRWR